MSISDDIKKAPHLFNLKKVKQNDVNKNISMPPQDLVEFWTEIGAGDIFETETIYSPMNDKNGDTVWEINQHYREKGLPSLFTLFHTGICISAYRTEEPKYVTLDKESFEVIESFSSLEEWYREALRSEYAERYGLGGLGGD